MALPPPRTTAALLAGVAVAVGVAALAADEQLVQPPAAAQHGVSDQLRVPFIANRGQTDRRVSFYQPGADRSVYFTRRGLTVSLPDRKAADRRWAFKLDFLGDRRRVAPVGRAPASTRVSYFGSVAGGGAAAATVAPTYGGVLYKQVWPGVDVAYSTRSAGLKYELRLAAGANVGDVRLGWQGVTGLQVDPRGRLQIATPAGTLTDDAPTAYQVVGGRRVPVEVSYALHGATAYGFRLGAHDRSRPVTIDPAIRVYSGFIGGSGPEQGNDVAVDRRGRAYVSGFTASSASSFPDKVGPSRVSGGESDAFVAKVARSGRRLVYAGFIGGSAADQAFGVTVDRRGSAYVTGVTASTDFPVRGRSAGAYGGGAFDAFLVKLAPSGKRLAFSRYLGGSGTDQGFRTVVDNSLNVYTTGFTGSTDFPTQVGPDLTYNGGPLDRYVAKLTRSGEIVWAGYVGGAGVDVGPGIGVDRARNVYIAGHTSSREDTFPVKGGPDLTYNGGPFDAYVTKIDSSGTGIAYSGYIGGAGTENGFGLAVSGTGHAYATGNTDSDGTFPVRRGPDLTFNGGSPGGGDAYVVKVNRAGTGLVYAGYIGGSRDEQGFGPAVDGRGNLYVTGNTDSRDFPARGGLDRTYNGGDSDAFVARVKRSGRRLRYAGYLGGRGADQGFGVAVDRRRKAYIAGVTDGFGFPVRRGPDRKFNGAQDAFVAKVAVRSRRR